MRGLSTLQLAEDRYRSLTPMSQQLHAAATEWMPGGTTRTTTFFPPYPVFVARGQGCRVWDVDGNERIDFINNYSALILGHSHPAVVAALGEQMENGTAFAAANPFEGELARILCTRVRSMEQVRFTNSGTESTMFALRVARAATGRQRFARIEGGYHGTHDLVEVSTHPDPAAAGDARRPRPVADSIGTPSFALDSVVVLPFNDPDAAEQILQKERASVGALIVEPVIGAGGVIPADAGYLQALREITERLGMLLIFDEVISFRVSRGGAQELYGVTPDLTTMAKVIGGGLPVAAFGGRQEYMELLDPRRPSSLPHGGTYNGNPLGMVAGIATMNQLTPAVYEDLNQKGVWLAAQLRTIFERHDVDSQVTNAGSLFCVHFTSEPVRDYRAAATADQQRARTFFLELLNRGIMLAPRGMGALSAVTGQAELEAFLAAVEDVVAAHADDWQEDRRPQE
jgi:glutamate-1-semialdehyde 2,1-aminomutase